MNIDDVFKLVLDDCKDPYARAYAHAGLYSSQAREDKRVQALYLLSNIQYWRHVKAKEARRILEEYTQQKIRANVRMKGK